MAHFRRRYPRNRCWRAIRGGQGAWRAKHGFRPVVLDYKDPNGFYLNCTQAERDKVWEPYPTYNRGKKIGGHLSMMNSVPAWWVRSFLVRPYRAKIKKIVRQVLIGRLDADDISWPPVKKSQGYYW